MFLFPSLWKQLIPARGRKPASASFSISSQVGNNSSPRGDGNLQFFGPPSDRWGNNSSPRGDGNVYDTLEEAQEAAKQLIPARGRKPVCVAGGVRRNRNNSSPRGDGNISAMIARISSNETTHPREGTETRSHRNLRLRRLRNNSSPRGDGNIVTSQLSRSLSSKQLIPARGRKLAYIG